MEWDACVASLRYVDDVMMISHVVCVDCLITFLHKMYTIEFDVSCRGRVL